MKKKMRWQIIFSAALVSLSMAFYVLHYLIFRDAHHIFIYLLGDIAFVFLEVLLVTMILHGLLEYHERQALLKKMNMPIGIFFADCGTELLRFLAMFIDQDHQGPAKALKDLSRWNTDDFQKFAKQFQNNSFPLKPFTSEDLILLKARVEGKRTLLLTLLGNSNILEHQQFTDLLWAVFHLVEELSYRDDMNVLPQEDKAHLNLDIARAWKAIVPSWLSYLSHLRIEYPYLFSLAVRMNPFFSEAQPIVGQVKQ